MRVLLLYPEFPSTFWSLHGALDLLGRKVLLPPLGLITVAALLPQQWELRLLDTNIRPVSAEDWAWAELVIASAMLVQRQHLAKLIREAKQQQLPVAVGGPFATSTPDAPELQDADYRILDEGEITIPLFLEALARGETQGQFRADGERPDVHQSPIPRFDLLDLKHYSMMAVQFSRGCPFQCEFCDIIVLYGRKPRTKEPSQLLAELDHLDALGWRGEIFLVDDNFIGNKRHVKRLLPVLLHWQRLHQWPFSFTTEASLDLAQDEELMIAMAMAGFKRVFLGIETPDQNSLKLTNKIQNTRHPLDLAVERITAHGLEVMAGFILGFDGETTGAGDRIVQFIERTGIPLAMVGILVALPNTALWHRLQKEGRLLESNDGFDQGVQTHLLNFRPQRPMPEIAAEFLQAFATLYEPHTYLERVFRYCCWLDAGRRRIGHEPEQHRRWHQSAGLLRGITILCWRQGVLRKTRWRFWKHLWQIATQHPLILNEYLWLLMLNEHFITYQVSMTNQVQQQLQLLTSTMPP